MVMLVRHAAVEAFMAMANDTAYLAESGIGLPPTSATALLLDIDRSDHTVRMITAGSI